MTDLKEKLKKTGWWPHLHALGERSLEEFLGVLENEIAEARKQGFRDCVEKIPDEIIHPGGWPTAPYKLLKKQLLSTLESDTAINIINEEENERA